MIIPRHLLSSIPVNHLRILAVTTATTVATTTIGVKPEITDVEIMAVGVLLTLHHHHTSCHGPITLHRGAPTASLLHHGLPLQLSDTSTKETAGSLLLGSKGASSVAPPLRKPITPTTQTHT
ncbi:hypothetical protein L1887_24792 [Cichorium endivia]|nr:hypothetical protein L1887_24792 [Cichorium endivia]